MSTSLLIALALAAAPADRPPNVVFVLADDLGWGDLGCYGQTKIQTPALDKMAAEGARFTAAYAGSCVCAPSRCALLTGKHMGHAAIRGNREVQPEGQTPLPAEETTIAEALAPLNFATAQIGKWGLGMVGSSGDPNAQGFGHYFGHICQRKAHTHYPPYLWRNGRQEFLPGNENGARTTYCQDLFTRDAIDFVRTNKARPFFLGLAYSVPHLAIEAPEDSIAPYRGRFPEAPYDGKKGYKAHPTPRAGYAAMVSRMDRDLGQFFEVLRDEGLDANTIVMFSSDNGATFDLGGADTGFFRSSGDLRGRKGTLYEGGIRVPLLVRWPGKVPPGVTIDRPTAFWDVFPTICELVGAQAPPGLDGASFVPALLGRELAPPAPLYWEHVEGNQRLQAVRRGDFKAVRDRRRGRAELFDLSRDPNEATDLSKTSPGTLADLLGLMEAMHDESATFPLGP